MRKLTVSVADQSPETLRPIHPLLLSLASTVLLFCQNLFGTKQGSQYHRMLGSSCSARETEHASTHTTLLDEGRHSFCRLPKTLGL